MSEFWKLSAGDLAKMVRDRKTTAREATEDAIARMEAVNPTINAVVQSTAEEALAAADAIDQKLADGLDPGPLAGVPVTVKVNVDQTGWATTNGVRIQKDLIAEQDNPVVANLRRAGAVIVGRTNTPAFSLRWFCRNALHGQTLNPRNTALTPGGSSGGAGSAVAAGIGAIGHGTDIAGSVRYPAYACGVHGLRPTLGRIPAANFSGPDRLLGAQIMAVSGPLARTIGDVRLGLQAMAARDPRDPWWVPVPHDLDPYPRRAALCINPEGLETVPEVEAALRESAAALTADGWEVVETEMPPIREPAKLDILLWMAEMSRGGGKMVEEEDDPDANHVYRMLCEVVDAPDANELLDTIQRRATLVREWMLFFENYPVLLCPVSAELPFSNNLDVESDAAFRRCFEAQIIQIGLPFMGLPGLTVTTGSAGDVPVGVQLVGGRYREDILLAAGGVIEAASPPVEPVTPA